MSSLGSSTSTVRPVSLPPMPLPLLPFLCSALLCTTDRQRHFVSLGTLVSLPPLLPAPLPHVSSVPPHCLILPALPSACLLAADPSTPLLVFYAPHVAHCPLQVPKEYYDKFSFMEDDEGEKKNGPVSLGFLAFVPSLSWQIVVFHGRGMLKRQLSARFCCREMQRSDGEGPPFDRPTLP
jgi:hypothetical protein